MKDDRQSLSDTNRRSRARPFGRVMRCAIAVSWLVAGAVAGSLAGVPHSGLGAARAADPPANTKHRDVVDASQYPWSAIGRVNMAGVRTRSHCTGALVGEQVVVTAAHCLYRRDLSKWALPGQVHFVAGYQRGEFQAHARGEQLFISPKFDPVKWVHPDNYPNDWAVIVLDAPIGRKVGYLGLLAMRETQLVEFHAQNRTFALAGYPRDRAHAISLDESCGIEAFFGGAHLMSHNCTIVNGDSGAPISLRFKGGLAVVGVNSAAGVSTNRGKVNTAVPIHAFIDTLIQAIRSTESAPEFASGPVRAGGLPANRGNAGSN